MSDRKYPELFAASDVPHMTACLNFSYDMSAGYVEGYLRAADRLVQYVAEEGRDQDFFVYPIAFMYRHHIELQLKRIISTGRSLLQEPGGHPKHHKLHDLWPLAKGILRQVWAGHPDPAEFAAIESFIAQFSKIDEDSTSFRYPLQKAGTPSLQGVRYVDLRSLAECVHSFSDFLDCAAGGLIDYLDAMRQNERDTNYY